MGNTWKQRKTGMLSLPPIVQNTGATLPNFLHPILIEGNSELRYYFKNGNNSLVSHQPAEYSFEEAVLLLPEFFKFVEYSYDPITHKVTITEPVEEDNPETVEFIFEKVLFNLSKTGGPLFFSPGSEHPCQADEDGIAATTSENCMIPPRTEDGNFLLMYAKNTKKSYRTESPNFQLRLNNYFIPLLSADMSIWWYKIPNYVINGDLDDVKRAKWADELHARKNAEKVLSIWHQDQIAYMQALEEYPALEDMFYVGVYQRSYFSDELQMRFTNVARIANDETLNVNTRVQDLSTIHYNPLLPNFPEVILAGNH